MSLKKLSRVNQIKYVFRFDSLKYVKVAKYQGVRIAANRINAKGI